MARSMDNKKKKKKSLEEEYSSPFKKRKTAGDKYIDRLEGMLNSTGSILMPRERTLPSAAVPVSQQSPSGNPEGAFTPIPDTSGEQPSATPAVNAAEELTPVTAAPKAQNMNTPLEQPTPAAFLEGAIIQWEGPTLGLYKQHDPHKGYDLIYILSPTGKLIPRGVALHGYQAEQIGFLPQNLLADFEKNMTWQRDVLVFHLFDYTYSSWVPVIHQTGQNATPIEQQPIYPKGGAVQEATPQAAPPEARPSPPVQPPAETVEAAPPPPPPKPVPPVQRLHRGSKFSIKIGNQEWEAIYWGEDLQGNVVAHNVDGEWKLMHLNLEKFQKSMKFKGELAKKEMGDLERQIRQSSATQY